MCRTCRPDWIPGWFHRHVGVWDPQVSRHAEGTRNGGRSHQDPFHPRRKQGTMMYTHHTVSSHPLPIICPSPIFHPLPPLSAPPPIIFPSPIIFPLSVSCADLAVWCDGQQWEAKSVARHPDLQQKCLSHSALVHEIFE